MINLPQGGYRILLAEDDADDFYTLNEAFRQQDTSCQLERTENGEELITQLQNRLINKQSPHLIILDINMPKLNGIETLRRIKEESTTSQIPVFMYSTSNDVNQMRKCYQLGAERFVTKGNHFQSVLGFARFVQDFLSLGASPAVVTNSHSLSQQSFHK